MKNISLRSAMVLLVFVTVALAQQSADDHGLLVFHRPKRFVGSALTPSILVDGREVARLDNGRYFSLPIPPGKHQLTSTMKHAPLEIEVKPGETVHLEMVILAGNWKGGGRLITTPQADALEAIKKLKPLDKKWMVDPKVGSELGTKGPEKGT
jgi:hypothetical protein